MFSGVHKGGFRKRGFSNWCVIVILLLLNPPLLNPPLWTPDVWCDSSSKTGHAEEYGWEVGVEHPRASNRRGFPQVCLRNKSECRTLAQSDKLWKETRPCLLQPPLSGLCRVGVAHICSLVSGGTTCTTCLAQGFVKREQYFGKVWWSLTL